MNKFTTLLICAVISVSLACTISTIATVRKPFDYHAVLTPITYTATPQPLTEAGAKVREWRVP